MSWLSYNKFILLNVFLTIGFIFGVFILGVSNIRVISNLVIVSCGFLAVLLMSENSKLFAYLSIIPTRIVIFGCYVMALILPFSHVLLSFSSNSNLIWLIYIYSFGLFSGLLVLKS